MHIFLSGIAVLALEITPAPVIAVPYPHAEAQLLQQRGGGRGERGSGQRGRGGRDGGQGRERKIDPVNQKDFEKQLEVLFRQGDSNQDGMITLDEFRAVIDERKNKLIAERFAHIDSNHNDMIERAEFQSWQESQGALAMEEDQATGRDIVVSEEIRLQPGNDRDAQSVTRLIDPLSASLIARANTDYDQGMTLEEYKADQLNKFTSLDSNGDGELSADELRGQRGDRRGPGSRRGPPDQPPAPDESSEDMFTPVAQGGADIAG